MKVYLGPYKGSIRVSIYYDHMQRKYGYCWPSDEKEDKIDNLIEKINDFINFLLDLTINKFRSTERKKYIKIHRYDTWNMDDTLALIILPMLKNLKNTKHGSGMVDDCDVPEELRNEHLKPDDYGGDESDEYYRLLHLKWDYVLDRMIESFESMDKENTPEYYNMSKGEYKEFYRRQQEGFILMGKYMRSLWD